MNLENFPTPICDVNQKGQYVPIVVAKELEQKLTLATKTLDDIIAGCCNPDVAIRRVMLELGPIRKTLRIIKTNENQSE
jgi:hypothetical protein